MINETIGIRRRIVRFGKRNRPVGGGRAAMRPVALGRTITLENTANTDSRGKDSMDNKDSMDKDMGSRIRREIRSRRKPH
jgi:hypothetical protein